MTGWIVQLIMFLIGVPILILLRNNIRNNRNKLNNNTLMIIGFACCLFCPALFFVAFYLQITIDG